MTQANEAAKRRKELEALGKLPHDRRFDDRIKRESRNCLLLIAALSAVVYAVGINYYYKTQAKAHESEILAKSEMSQKEIKQLNISKAIGGKSDGTR